DGPEGQGRVPVRRADGRLRCDRCDRRHRRDAAGRSGDDRDARRRSRRDGVGDMTFRGAVFLGIGSMVGAGIFALLGEAGAIAGAGVWISFLLAGLISLALGYALAKLGVRYPSSGGIVTYLIKAFGNGRIVGIASWLG